MRRLSLSFAQVAASSLIGQAIGFAVLAVVARRIGPTNLGAYAFASNFILYITIPLIGLVMFTVRAIAQDRAAAPRLAGAILPVSVSYVTCACLVVYILAPHIAPTPVAATMLRILTVSAVVSTLTIDWFLEGLQMFDVLALMRVLGQVCYGVAAFFLITSGQQGAYRYAWLNVFGLVVTLVGIWLYVVRIAGWPTFRFSLYHSLNLIKQSSPFAVSLVMIQLYYSADFVLLGFLSNSAGLGQYLVAYKLPLLFLGLGSLWIAVFYPHAATQEWPVLRRQIGTFTTLSFILIIPLCAGSFVLAEPLMTTLFGSHYASAGLYFKTLMFAVGCATVDVNIGQSLLAIGYERTFALGVSCGAFANIALNFILIPSLGPEGSAIATIAAEAIVLVFMTSRLQAVIGMPRLAWRRIAAAAVSASGMVLVLTLVVPRWSVFPRIGLGVLAYLALAHVTRAVRPSDYRLLSRTAALS
jgi:O-antigen/teichoic acid export membrane protein